MKNAIKYVKGDLFKLPKNNFIIPHVCNDKGAWGAGFVVPLAKHYPSAKETYLSEKYLRLGQTQYALIKDDVKIKGYVANMIAQTLGGDRPLYYNHLAYCMDTVASFVLCTDEKLCIHCPKFGSGLAGGNWDFIEQLIIDCWIKRDVSVTVYSLD